MDAGIALHLTDEGPVGLASVHLCAGAPVDGEGCNTAVLQLLGKVGDDELLGVPAKSGFHCDGGFYCLHHLARDVEHEGDVLQHTGTGTFACHLLHRTTEVEVDDIGMHLLHNLCRLHHGGHVATVDLNAHRSLFVADGEFVDGGLHRAHQCLGTYKLSIYHSRPESLAQHPESDIRHVLHRSEKQWFVTKFYISNLHSSI